MINRRFAYTALSLAFCVAGPVFAQPQSRVREFVPFKSFLETAHAADSMAFRQSGSRVKDAAAFEEMRQHLIATYRGVEVKHSYVQHSSHFDCVPTEQQPTVRAFGLKSIASAPPQSLLTEPTDPADGTEFQAAPATQLSAGKQTDEFGNAIGCEQGTIPMRRLTLEEMAQFPTLREFFQKGPDGAARPSLPDIKEIPGASAAGHKYSIMFEQVDNLGGNSNLNLWSPYVNTWWGEIFSLSQEWYIGGSGPSQQTAEVGWQNYPAKYGNEVSRLFIYFTADNYNQTGCYNLDCPAFVQVSNSATLGGGFSNYSAYGGTQYEFSAKYYLYQNNWWLAIQGTWIGYYPGAVYRGGQLARYAQAIEFGTESVGTSVWPGEGSGSWSTAGFGSAAYQRNLYYINGSGAGVWDSLTAYDPSPSCYSTSGPYFSSTANWGVYFYEGGPGGPGC
jgi:hypothetical protein